MRKHRLFFALTLLEVAVLAVLVASCRHRLDAALAGPIPAQRALAGRLGLTDLAIWTEARYTRHPSQADRFAPFQDFPSSIEHFPAGSIVGPPERPGDSAPRAR